MSSILYGLFLSECTDLPFYIGQAKSVRRAREHYNTFLQKGRHWNVWVTQMFQKMCKPPVIKVLAEFEDRQDARQAEKDAIRFYGRMCDQSGILCNINSGGNGPRTEDMIDPQVLKKTVQKHSRKTKLAMSERMKRVSKTLEWKTLVSQETKKALHTPEVRERHLSALERINLSLTTEQRQAHQAKRSTESIAKSTAQLLKMAQDENINKIRSEKSTQANLKNWQDPMVREKRVANMRGAKAKKRALINQLIAQMKSFIFNKNTMHSCRKAG